ncbi:hypothetical protein EVAR_56098_1 [Eumeta japonica]|uniref:Uncharacterized protein n=1 Tax=Eumeta variegata TaxID=151549 RepID=A0A4C1YC39_EUMVA|nr:hypothetical protein EVAR_56098_1 [Eumeta japonica]
MKPLIKIVNQWVQVALAICYGRPSPTVIQCWPSCFPHFYSRGEVSLLRTFSLVKASTFEFLQKMTHQMVGHPFTQIVACQKIGSKTIFEHFLNENPDGVGKAGLRAVFIPESES